MAKPLNTAIAQAVARGGRVESQNEDQAIIVYPRVHPGKLTLCCLIWWPGFLFGHHRSTRRELVQIDSDGNTLIQKV